MAPTETTPTDAALQLRPALPEDRASMAQIHIRARAAAQMPRSPLSAAELVADFAAAWDADAFWVATGETAAGARVHGYVRFVLPDGERVGWLDDLYVDPSVAGQGTGSALLDVAKAHLPGGFGLWAFERNAGARAFYRANGLREASRVPAHHSPHGEPEVEIRWP